MEIHSSQSSKGSYAGHLLVARPSLNDPNFEATVVLISVHSEEDGAIGVVLNRPLGKTLAQYSPEFMDSAIGKIPLYTGGPVATESMIVTAWQWRGEEGVFRLHFGITESDAETLGADGPKMEFRGFVGHAGWGQGQLEAEVEEKAWWAMPLSLELFAEMEKPGNLWRRLVSHIQPQLSLDAGLPPDPSVN